MESNTSVCEHCGENSVQWDDHCESGAQKICTSCGVVYNETKLVSTNFGAEGTSYGAGSTLPDAYYRAHCAKIPEGLKVGRERIRVICSSMALQSHQKGALALYDQLFHKKEFNKSERIRVICSSMALQSHQKGALALYDQLFHKKEFNKTQIDTKITLAVWCVYIECRKAGLPLTMQYIANVTGIQVHKLFRIHKECKDIMTLDLPHQDITELVEIVLANEVKPEVTCTNLTKELTKDLVMICKQLWLVEGRQTHLIILSAFFLAWQAENFTERKRKSFAEICKYKSVVRTCSKRVSEFRRMLCALARHLPWVDKVTAYNVGFYVKDIVRYQRSVMMDAMRKNEMDLVILNTPPDQRDQGQISQGQITQGQISQDQRSQGQSSVYESGVQGPVLSPCADNELDPHQFTQNNLQKLDQGQLHKSQSKLDEQMMQNSSNQNGLMQNSCDTITQTQTLIGCEVNSNATSLDSDSKNSVELVNSCSDKRDLNPSCSKNLQDSNSKSTDSETISCKQNQYGYNSKDIASKSNCLQTQTNSTVTDSQFKSCTATNLDCLTTQCDSNLSDSTIESTAQSNSKSPSKDFEKRKKDMDTECLFMPPSYKKARRKSIEQEEILDYIKEGRKHFVDIARKMNSDAE